MAESRSFDETFHRRKKIVVIVAALVLLLLGGTLIGEQVGSLIRVGTPPPTAVAELTTLPPATAASATATATQTPSPAITPTAVPTETPVVTTAEPLQPPTPTSTPSPTPKTPTPVPSPSPTPETPTPTTPPSPTPETPTPTPTAQPPPRRPLVILNPADGSQLPSVTLTIGGTAEPGITVEVHAGDILLGETAVDQVGNWSLIPVKQLTAGQHTIAATDVGTGETSPPVTFTLLQAWLPVTGSEQPCRP